MARLNENFDSDENYLGPPVTPHAIPRSPLQNPRTTLQENQESQAITSGQKSHKASTEEELQIAPLEPAKEITKVPSGTNSLRRQRLLKPLSVNLLAFPTQTDAVQSDKLRSLTLRNEVKTPSNRVNSDCELPPKSSTVLEGRQASKDPSDYVVIDSTSETDDDTRGDFFPQTQRDAHKTRGQKHPKLRRYGTGSKLSGKSAWNIPSITVNTTLSNKPVLGLLAADCSSKANISPESRVSEAVSADDTDMFLRW